MVHLLWQKSSPRVLHNTMHALIIQVPPTNTYEISCQDCIYEASPRITMLFAYKTVLKCINMNTDLFSNSLLIHPYTTEYMQNSTQSFTTTASYTTALLMYIWTNRPICFVLSKLSFVHVHIPPSTCNSRKHQQVLHIYNSDLRDDFTPDAKSYAVHSVQSHCEKMRNLYS